MLRNVARLCATRASFSSQMASKIIDLAQECLFERKIVVTMITTFDICNNAYSSIAQASLTMDDLFG